MVKLKVDLNKASQDRETILEEKKKIEIALKNRSAYSKKSFESLLQKMENLQEKLQMKDSEIETYTVLLNEVEGERQYLALQVDRLKKEKEDIEEQITVLQGQLDKSAKYLEKNWTTTYKTIDFNPKVFKEVVKEFSGNDIPYIQSTLVEMVAADDPRSLPNNRGKMHDSGLEHIAFRSDSPGRIFYRINPNNSNQSIYIEQITKHNDSRYGKR